MDVQFRRTPARERLSKLNHEIDTLKRSLEDASLAKRPYPEGPPSTGYSEAEGSEGAREGTGTREREERAIPTFCPSADMVLDLQDDQIGDFVLPREELIPLFST